MSFFQKLASYVSQYEKHFALVALPLLSIVVLGVGVPLALLAEELPSSNPPVSDTIFCNALGRQATIEECGTASSQQSGSTIIFCEALGRQATKDECALPTSQQAGSTIIFCDVLGKQTTKDQCPGINGNQQPQQNNNQQINNNSGQGQPGNQGGQSQQFNGGQNGGNGQNNFGPGNNVGPKNGGGGQGMGPGGGQNQQQMDERRIKDMKREATNMEREYNLASKAFDKMEKSGVVISPEIKDNLVKVKGTIDALKNVTAGADMENIDVGETHGILGDLRQSQNEMMQKAQQFKDLQRNLKQMEQGVKMFDRQLVSLTKQKVPIPADVADTLKQFKEKIASIKNATSVDQLDSSTFDDLQELMQKINDSRQQLDMLARWPQAIKQVTQQLNNFDRDVKRSKTTVDRLAKQGIDLSDTYAKYQQAVAGLKAAKADAEAKMAEGNAEGAFTALEDGFFNEMDSVGQYQRVIQTMANLSRFNVDFKQSVKQAQNQINALKKQKIDVSELQAILAQAKDQGVVVLAKMKEKPIDEEGVLTELQTMEDLRQQFSDKAEELGGDMGGPLPWEQGSKQFQGQTFQMPQNFGQFMNNNQGDPSPMQDGGPSFAPGTGPNNMAP